jgi:DNA-binding FrmR family transcriptional regulator
MPPSNGETYQPGLTFDYRRFRARHALLRHAPRVAGQVGALAGMIEQEPAHAEVVQQVLAARASLDALLVRLLDAEIQRCVTDDPVRAEIEDYVHVTLGRPARSGASRRFEGRGPGVNR